MDQLKEICQEIQPGWDQVCGLAPGDLLLLLLLRGLQPEEGTRLRAHTRKTSLACAELDSRHASWLPGTEHYALVIRRTRKQASYQLTFGGYHLGTVETIDFDRYLFFKGLLIASMRLLHLSTKLQYNASDLAVSHQLAALLREASVAHCFL